MRSPGLWASSPKSAGKKIRCKSKCLGSNEKAIEKGEEVVSFDR